jgi:hypothetical protein
VIVYRETPGSDQITRKWKIMIGDPVLYEGMPAIVEKITKETITIDGPRDENGVYTVYGSQEVSLTQLPVEKIWEILTEPPEPVQVQSAWKRLLEDDE